VKKNNNNLSSNSHLGGPGVAVERMAKIGDPHKFQLTVPMKFSKSLDFSFSGLKTNVKKL